MQDQPETTDLGIANRLSRSPERGARNQNVNARVSCRELDQFKAAARKQGKGLGEWARDALFQAAKEPDGTRAIFTELVALRMLLNNVLRPVALGEHMTPEAYAQVIAEVRSTKHDRAKDLLAQYENPTGGN